MNKISQEWTAQYLATWIHDLRRRGYTVRSCDPYESESYNIEDTLEAANEILFAMDFGVMEITCPEGSVTTISMIAENEEDLVSDWAPASSHLTPEIERFSDAVFAKLGS